MQRQITVNFIPQKVTNETLFTLFLFPFRIAVYLSLPAACRPSESRFAPPRGEPTPCPFIDSHASCSLNTHPVALWHQGSQEWRWASLCLRYSHTHTPTHADCKHSCRCLRLVAALTLAHICSSIDPPVPCTSPVCWRTRTRARHGSCVNAPDTLAQNATFFIISDGAARGKVHSTPLQLAAFCSACVRRRPCMCVCVCLCE